MAITDIAEQYVTFERRLESFLTAQPLSKRRASNASTKGPKSLKWPHKFLTAEELAKAGFFYYPQQSNPDNVACFLCHKALDGWEEDDDPLVEHLKHSPDCGWAILATIEKQDGELSEEYPLSTKMIEARKATFGDMWPHESKKGWKCKVKQMVDAGWKYTPSLESDDMATCAYCSLALDGWEKGDKPLDEHHNRSPECTFFTLVSNHKQTPKPTKAKRDRTSKASRLSTQSSLTIGSEAPSAIDLLAEDGDSILTTATNATAKRMVKARKAAAPPKTRKTRAKKDEPSEILDAHGPEDADFEVKVDVPEPSRAKKRKSEDQLEAIGAPEAVGAPPPKRRATRTRGSAAANSSVIEESRVLPKSKGRNTRTSRNISMASQISAGGAVPNDDEIDRALEADLQRPLVDDEEQQVTLSKTTTSQYSMFGAEPMDINEAELEAELDAMEVDSKRLPKAKGAKATQVRKVSVKQRAAAKKAAEAEAAAEAQRAAEEEAAAQQIEAELEDSIMIQQSPKLVPKRQRASTRQAARPLPTLPTQQGVMPGTFEVMDVDDDEKNESGNETDASQASQSTVIRGSSTRHGSGLKRVKGGRKGSGRSNAEPARLTWQAEEPRISDEAFFTPAPETAPIVQKATSKVTKAKAPKAAPKPRGRTAQQAAVVSRSSEIVPDVHATAGKEDRAPATAAKNPSPPPRSPSPRSKESTPARSPNSSDAENQPPSSKPSAASKKAISTPRSSGKRVPLADTTPHLSPSKRNVIHGGLRSEHPWTAVDLDMLMLRSPGGGGADAVDIFGAATADKLRVGELSSPEKRMTVEEWIKHNAEMAEEKLRMECERMVGLFESQGTRAMRALEGVECWE